MAEPDLIDSLYNNSSTNDSIQLIDEEKEEDDIDLLYASPTNKEEEVLVEEEDDIDLLYGKPEVASAKSEDTRTAYERVEQAEEGTKTLDEFAEDEEFLQNVNEYGKARFGDDGIQQEGESNKEYVERFLTHTRQLEANSLDLDSMRKVVEMS
mgnify:FL=1